MSFIPFSEINSLSLYPLGNKDNEIDSHVIILHQDGMRNDVPVTSGIHDASMGSTSHNFVCGTCKYDKRLCPGHFGSIVLKYPVLSPIFLKETIKWLKLICFNCGKLIINHKKMNIRKDKILVETVKLATKSANKNIICIHCGAKHPHITKDKSDPVSIFMENHNTKVEADADKPGKKIIKIPLLPHSIKIILDKVSNETVIDMGKDILAHPNKFVINVVRGPPNPIRPDIKKIGGGRSGNNDITVLLQAIVKINEEMPDVIPAVPDHDMMVKIHNLNLAVYDMIKGSSSANKRSIVNSSKKPLTSIAKRLPRKYGRIRRNLMGRRAIHMARSFITCDTFLKIDEIGVPISIARNIQFPEIVRSYNYDQMSIYFMNGTQRYPGCTKIKKGNNSRTYFVSKVEKLEIGDTIYRDIVEGDLVNFNRQPSLEPSSISCMKVIIMEKGDTIRMNILACPSTC